MSLKLKQSPIAPGQCVTISVGVAVAVPDTEANFGNIYLEADKALYTAKNKGKNQTVCSWSIM